MYERLVLSFFFSFKCAKTEFIFTLKRIRFKRMRFYLLSDPL